MFNSDMSRKEWRLVLVFANFIVIILSAVVLRFMEGNIMIGLHYFGLIAYLAFGVWLLTRRGRKRGMVREKARNKTLHMVLWFLGCFPVFSIVTPW